MNKVRVSETSQHMKQKRQEYRISIRKLRNNQIFKQVRLSLMEQANELQKGMPIYKEIQQNVLKHQPQKINEGLIEAIKLLKVENKISSINFFNSGVCQLLLYLIQINYAEEHDLLRKQFIELPVIQQTELLDLLTENILTLFALLNYEFSTQVSMIINTIWRFIEMEDVIKSKSVLTIFTNLLKESKISFSILQNKGLPHKICQLIQDKSPIQEYLLDLIVNYSILDEQRFSEESVTQFFVSAYKETFLSFGYQQLEYGKYLEKSLRVISILLENNRYLAQMSQEETILSFLNYLGHPSLEVVLLALECIDDLIYYSNLCTQTLLQHNLFDYLERRLVAEENINDEYQSLRLKKITYIISNSLLVENKSIRKTIRRHTILDKVYSSLNPHSKFFVLVRVFEYYFHSSPTRDIFNILESYLQAVSVIDLKEAVRDEVKVLRNTIESLYTREYEYWQDKHRELFISLLQKYNLKWIVDELQ